MRWPCTEQRVWGLLVLLPSKENQLGEKGLGQSVDMLRRYSLNLDSVNFEGRIPFCVAESTMLVAPEVSDCPLVPLLLVVISNWTHHFHHTKRLEGAWACSAQQLCIRAPCAQGAEGSWSPLSTVPHRAPCPEHRVLVRNLTTQLCLLLNFCKSTSVRPVPVGCDGLPEKLLGPGTSWGQVTSVPHSAQPHRDHQRPWLP